jgi:hypothetical protein
MLTSALVSGVESHVKTTSSASDRAVAASTGDTPAGGSAQ